MDVDGGQPEIGLSVVVAGEVMGLRDVVVGAKDVVVVIGLEVEVVVVVTCPWDVPSITIAYRTSATEIITIVNMLIKMLKIKFYSTIFY